MYTIEEATVSTRKGILQAIDRLLQEADETLVMVIQNTRGESLASFRLTPAAEALAPEPGTVEGDIFEVLQLEGHRLTTDEVFEALTRHAKVWSDSAVKLALARMVKDQTITNDPKARPHRGYGLPDW